MGLSVVLLIILVVYSILSLFKVHLYFKSNVLTCSIIKYTISVLYLNVL